LRYRKTTIKTNRILTDKNTLISLFFIKVVVRALKQGFNIIYCDESSLQSMNSNIKIWRKEDETFTSKLPKKEKFNLILAVYEKGVVYYEINKANTDEETFLNYMDNLKKEIEKKNIWPYLIVLDNLSCHKTKKIYEFYQTEKINVLFNSPYLSDFNSVELGFRNLKKKIYSKIFANTNDLINEVRNILISNEFNDSIRFNLAETLSKYLLFSKNKK